MAAKDEPANRAVPHFHRNAPIEEWERLRDEATDEKTRSHMTIAIDARRLLEGRAR